MNNQLTVAQILGALQRHRMKALLAWAAVMAIVVVLYLVWPRQYNSEGRLYVKMDRNNTSVVPSSSGAPVAIQDTRETEIRSVIEIIRSRAVVDAVVDEVGASEILENGIFDYLPSLSSLRPSSGGSKGMDPAEYKRLRKRELASSRLFKCMEVSNEKKSSVISVTVEANSPLLAQKIVAAIFKVTRKIHLGVHNVSSSADFFDEQFVKQEKVLNQAVQELAEFRNGLGVMSVSAAQGSVQGIISGIDLSLVNANVSLAESKDRMEKLRELLIGTPKTVAMPKRGVERLSYEDSRTELYKLKQERERLRTRLTDRDVRLKTLSQQIVALERELGSMPVDRTESQSEPNPVYQALETDLLQAKAKLAGDKARLASLKQEKMTASSQLKMLNTAEIDADEKLRNVQVAEQYLAIYTKPRGEAKAMGALDDMNISDVRVSQPPTLTLKHVNPKASLVLPLGFVCGLLVALGASLFFDRNHLSAVMNENEVEQVLGLPVLVSLPRVYSSRNMVN